MIYIDTSVLPSLADTFRNCGELMSGIKQDLKNYMHDARNKFNEQVTILTERFGQAERQLKEAKERQECASRNYQYAISNYNASINNLDNLKEKRREIRREGESYKGERVDIRQQIRDQKDEIEANEQYLEDATANLEQANIELQNAQAIYDDAKYRLEESKRIVGNFRNLSDQYSAIYTAPQKDVRIELQSEVYTYKVYQNYSINTMLAHLSKDYIDKVVTALDNVQQKVDAILHIGQQHFDCHIEPTRAVMPSTSDTVNAPRKNMVNSQAVSGIYCPKCLQLKAICRCNEIIEKTVKSYRATLAKIQELKEEAKELKAKIDLLEPFEKKFDSLYDEVDQIEGQKRQLMDEYYANKANTEQFLKDRKRELVQAAWDRDKDDEKVYHSPEMNSLFNTVDAMDRKNELLRDQSFRLDDKRDGKQAEAHEALEAQRLEERRLGGTLAEFKEKYKTVIFLLESKRKRLAKYRGILRNYGVKIDKEGNILTN